MGPKMFPEVHYKQIYRVLITLQEYVYDLLLDDPIITICVYLIILI